MRIILNNPYKVATDGQIFVDFGNGFQKFNLADVRTSGITIPSYVTDLSVIKIKTGSEIINNIDVLYNAQTFADWNRAQDNKEVTLTENQTFVIEPDEGSDVLRKVTAHVEVPQVLPPNLETKDVEFTTNDSYTITPSEGFDGINQVNVNVNVPDRELNLEEKEVEFNGNGTWYIEKSDDTFDGISKVKVDVNVDTEAHNLEEKFETITKNGLHTFENSPVEEGQTPYNGFQSVSALIAVEPKIAEVEDITYTDNGDYDIKVPEGVDEDGQPWDGLGNIRVHVAVPNPAPVVETQNLVVTQNGPQTLRPNENFEGIGEANIDVQVYPTVNITQNITNNGTTTIEIPETKLREKEDGEEAAPVGKVTVNVSVPAPEMILSEEEITIDANTDPNDPIILTPQGEANGIASVKINVNVPNPHEVEEKEVTATENDIDVVLEPSEGLEGISKATVHIAVPMDEGDDVIFIDPTNPTSNDRVSVENGVITILPQEGKAGLKKVKIVLTTSLTDPIYIEPEEEDENTEINDNDFVVGN